MALNWEWAVEYASMQVSTAGAGLSRALAAVSYMDAYTGANFGRLLPPYSNISHVAACAATKDLGLCLFPIVVTS